MKATPTLPKNDHGLIVRRSPETDSALFGSIVQRIDLFISDGKDIPSGNSSNSKPVGHALWYSSGSMDGHIQILELEIDKSFQRQGFGSRLMRIVRDEADAFFFRRKSKLRRITIEVPHKKQVIGRAFLTKHGFHHVETLKHILIEQDLLIYQLGLN